MTAIALDHGVYRSRVARNPFIALSSQLKAFLTLTFIFALATLTVAAYIPTAFLGAKVLFALAGCTYVAVLVGTVDALIQSSWTKQETGLRADLTWFFAFCLGFGGAMAFVIEFGYAVAFS